MMSNARPHRPIGPAGPPRGTPAADLAEVDVAIVCEATYPYVTGGLAAVVHQFCAGMDALRIGIVYIGWDSSAELVEAYDLPSNVAWVHTVYTSMGEYPHFQRQSPRDVGLPKRHHQRLVARLFAAIDAHREGNDEPLWSLFDDGINPLTRTFDLWPLISTEWFMDGAVARFGGQLPLSTLFWRLRDFASIAAALTSREFPKAKAYHSHTSGGAALLAAAAARQHGAGFLLTEHNLYARDAINLMLNRSGSTVVTRDTWHELDHFVGGDSVNPVALRVTPEQRAWMAWTTAISEIGYRAADAITYLYPEAIVEAEGLGGRPEISQVIANGIDTAPYLDGRRSFAARRPQVASASHRWRLAFAARVVVIKGLVDLIEAVALLAARGVTDFILDVMGPTEEEPEYVRECMRRIEHHGLQGRIRYVGSVHIPTVLPSYDLMVLPSHNEGAPIVILEALAMGIPTLATRVGGVEAILARQETDPSTGEQIGPGGVVVNPGDVVALADALQSIMSDPEGHATLSENAVQRAERLFHIDVMLERYGQVLGELGAMPSPSAGRRALPPDEALASVGVAPRRGIDSGPTA